MTREEVIKRIKMILEEATANEDAVSYVTSDDADALDMAIKALEQVPCREADDYENEISDLHNRLDIVEYDKERLREEVTTLEEKLKGLSAEPCEDTISRQAALDGLGSIAKVKAKSDAQKSLMGRVMFFVGQLPPVTPQPKMGKWIKSRDSYGNNHFTCPFCEHDIATKADALGDNYCSNCGARLEADK